MNLTFIKYIERIRLFFLVFLWLIDQDHIIIWLTKCNCYMIIQKEKMRIISLVYIVAPDGPVMPMCCMIEKCMNSHRNSLGT